MLLNEIKKPDIPRDRNGKALRGLAKDIALQQKKADKDWKEYDVKDDMVGAARKGSTWNLLNRAAKDMGEFGIATMSEEDMAELIDLKAADKYARDEHGEFGFATCSETEMEEIINKYPNLVKASLKEGEVIQGNFKQHGKVLVSHRRDAGDEWKYWNGVNWFNPKSRAIKVPVDKVEKLISTWGMDKQGTETRVQPINEEALETQNIEDVWAENSDSASYYKNSTQYQVRQITGSNPPKYEAFAVVGDQRKPFGKFTTDELKSTLEPIRAGQKPDAEGFTTYVDPEKVEAFKYSGDPIKVMIGKTGGRLTSGDYVVRSNDGNNFLYSIEKASTFEATLTK